MPFKSEKQRKWMWANEPEMAKKWSKKEQMKQEINLKKSLNKKVKEILVREYSKEYAQGRAETLSPNYQSIQSNIEKGKLQAEKEVNDIANQVQHLLNKGDLDGAEALMKTLYTDNPNNPANVYKNTQYSKENPEGEVVGVDTTGDGEPDSSIDLPSVGVVGNQEEPSQEPSQEPSETKPGFMAQAGQWMGDNPEATLALGGAGLLGTHLLTKKKEKKKRDESVNENGGPIVAYDMKPGEFQGTTPPAEEEPEVVITKPEEVEPEVVITKPEDDWTTDIPPAGTEERKAHYDKYNKRYDDSIPGYDADGNALVVNTDDEAPGNEAPVNVDANQSVDPNDPNYIEKVKQWIHANPAASVALGVGGLGLTAAHLLNKKDKKDKKDEALTRNIKNLIREDARPKSLQERERLSKLSGYKIISEKSTLKKLAKAALLIGGGALLHKMYQDGTLKNMWSQMKSDASQPFDKDHWKDTDKNNERDTEVDALNNKSNEKDSASLTTSGGGGDPKGPYNATNQFMRKKGFTNKKITEVDAETLAKNFQKKMTQYQRKMADEKKAYEKAMSNNQKKLAKQKGKYDEGFAGALPANQRAAFDSNRRKQSEVLGYKLTGKSDVKVEVDDATQHQQGHRLSEDSDYKKMMGFGSKK